MGCARAAGFWLAVFVGLATAGAGCEHGGGSGASPVEPPGDQPAFPLIEGHVDQGEIAAGVLTFAELFDFGDELFEVEFNGLDGVGVLELPNGDLLPSRFSRIPPGGGRFTGPNAQACAACHNAPLPTSAGEAASNVLQDPALEGVGPFNVRNPTSLFGSAVPQRLAEEITERLQILRAQGAAQLGPDLGDEVRVALTAKGVDYGAVTLKRVAPSASTPDGILIDVSQLEGVDPDLVVRPYGWKGNLTTLRDFVRDAAFGEMGMLPEELVLKINRDLGTPLGSPGFDADPDGDGVGEEEPELTVGDITAITIYIAAQEIPQPLERLVREGLAAPPQADEQRLIDEGRDLFDVVGCATCHIPELRLADPVFEEPTLRGGGAYFDAELAADEDGYDASRPSAFHLVQEGDFPRLVPHPQGGARVQLFSDLKRHDMGAGLADPQDVVPVEVRGADGRPVDVVVEDGLNPGQPTTVRAQVGATTFLTPELWGVGNAGRWLHDGRAATLEEAILLHGGEAQAARDAFAARSERERLAVVEFLSSLQHFALPEDEGE